MFKPGESGNPNGRPKGAQNKVSAASKQFIKKALEGVYDSPEEMSKDIKKIADQEKKIGVLVKLYEFVTPKLQRVDSKVSHKDPVPIHITKTYLNDDKNKDKDT